MEFKGLKRQTSQASMSPFGAGPEGSEVFDRQGPAASRLERQESVPVIQLVRPRLLNTTVVLHNTVYTLGWYT